MHNKFFSVAPTPMKTTEQIEKIKATVLYILKNTQKDIDYIHLFKVMYFAQKEHLLNYGLPIMDDSFYARKHGPVPAFTYKVLHIMEGKADDASDEIKNFANNLTISFKDGHQMVGLKEGADCDMDELSESNIETLDKWIAKCKDVKAFELINLSHDKAWEKANRRALQTGEDTKIPLYDIAEAAGASKEMLGVIRERVSNFNALL